MSRLPLALLLAACVPAPKPLPEALLGEWEVLCRTDQETTATCLGKEGGGLYKRIRAGGELVIGARSGTSMTGTWKLAGDTLVFTFDAGSMHLEEVYRARVEDDRLVLWAASRGWGMVLGRVGAPFVAAPTRRSTADRTTHAIGGVAYALALPADYALTRDDNNRQVWSPADGPGLTVHLTLSPRAQALVDGRWVTPPCSPDMGGLDSSSTEIAGVQRTVSLGLSRCLDGSDQSLACNVEHSRGYLEDGEKDAATALCESLTVKS